MFRFWFWFGGWCRILTFDVLQEKCVLVHEKEICDFCDKHW